MLDSDTNEWIDTKDALFFAKKDDGFVCQCVVQDSPTSYTSDYSSRRDLSSAVVSLVAGQVVQAVTSETQENSMKIVIDAFDAGNADKDKWISVGDYLYFGNDGLSQFAVETKEAYAYMSGKDYDERTEAGFNNETDKYEMINYLGMTESQAFNIFGEENFRTIETGTKLMIAENGSGETEYSIAISNGIVSSVTTKSEQYTVLGIKSGDNNDSIPDTVNIGKISAVKGSNGFYSFEINGVKGEAYASQLDMEGNIYCFDANLILTLKDYDPAIYNVLREMFPTDEGWGEISEIYGSGGAINKLPKNLFNMEKNHACDGTDEHYSGESVECRGFQVVHNDNKGSGVVRLYVNGEGKMIGTFQGISGFKDYKYYRIK